MFPLWSKRSMLQREKFEKAELTLNSFEKKCLWFLGEALLKSEQLELKLGG